MIGATALGEHMVFDSFAATTEAPWLQWLRRARRSHRSIRNETAAPPEAIAYRIRQMNDCEDIASLLTVLTEQPYGATAAELAFDQALQLHPWTDESRIMPNRTTCRREQERLMASTVWQEQTVDIYRLAEVAFRAAEEESFEDGVESEFSRQLMSLVKRFGNVVIDIISSLIDFQQVNGEVASVALRTLGEMVHPLSRTQRLRLLMTMLSSPSVWVRDGAALGLAWIDDPAAIPDLENAIERETIEELRRDMTAILEHLARAR